MTLMRTTNPGNQEKGKERGKEGKLQICRKDRYVVPYTKEIQNVKGKLLNPTILSISSQESMCIGKGLSLPSPKRLFSHSLPFLLFKDTNLSALSLLFEVFAILKEKSRKENVDLVLVLFL